MLEALQSLATEAIARAFSSEPRPGLHPIPSTNPLTLEAALLPPIIYYIALLFLPSADPPAKDSVAVKILRNVLAAIAAILFLRLPLAYHVPQSIGLTYQLGLVGIYGGCRVVDAFFISAIIFNHVPKRVLYTHFDRPESQTAQTKEWSDGGIIDAFMAKTHSNGAMNTPNGSVARTPLTAKSKTDSYFPSPSLVDMALSAARPRPVYETARTEQTHPTTFLERASWALELEMSMRGIGFTWTTADVRHTRETWLPTVANRIHSILVHVLPVLIGGGAVIRGVCVKYLADTPDLFEPKNGKEVFDASLPFAVQLALTLAMGAFLMAAFSLGHSLFAIMCSPLAPSQLAFFPPMYTVRVWKLTTVRKFWSYGWHRLFARLFLVYGV